MERGRLGKLKSFNDFRGAVGPEKPGFLPVLPKSHDLSRDVRRRPQKII
jgi:hypothetical protein